MTEHDFNQMIAEATHHHGVHAVLPLIERAARIFGWPIPAEYRVDVILGLCAVFPPKRPEAQRNA